MTKDLNLSASQAEKIQAINLKHISANEKTKQEMKVLKERMKKEREAAKAEIDAVLTPEQREILKKQEAERAAKRKQNQGERGPKK
jgi:Spy/CpxP family protein refolding chaperone